MQTRSDGEVARVLEGKRVAILVTNGFEQAELREPRAALQAAGAGTGPSLPVALAGW